MHGFHVIFTSFATQQTYLFAGQKRMMAAETPGVFAAPRRSTMAYLPFVVAKGEKARASDKRKAEAPAKRGFFRRLLDALIEARRREADREIERFLQAHGGKLTDSAEREIERRFLRQPRAQW